MTVVKLPVVTVLAVGEWLRGHHRTPALPAYPRDLMGCLFAHGGQPRLVLGGEQCGIGPGDRLRAAGATDEHADDRAEGESDREADDQGERRIHA